MTAQLSAIVDVVRFRDGVRLHWIPLTWGFLLLVMQFQYWWNFFSLSAVDRSWTNGDFLLVIFTTIALTTSGSLSLPGRGVEKGIDLWDYYRAAGRLAPLTFIAYLALGTTFNVVIYENSLVDWVNALLIPVVALSLVAGLAGSRTRVGIATVLICLIYAGVWVVTIVPSF